MCDRQRPLDHYEGERLLQVKGRYALLLRISVGTNVLIGDLSGDRWGEIERLLTSQTSCLGGFCGPGGSVVKGSCTRGSRAAEDGDNAFAYNGGLPKTSMVVVILKKVRAQTFFSQVAPQKWGPGVTCAKPF
jgi:hypothetical protein